MGVGVIVGVADGVGLGVGVLCGVAVAVGAGLGEGVASRLPGPEQATARSANNRVIPSLAFIL